MVRLNIRFGLLITLLLALSMVVRGRPSLYELPLTRNDSARWHRNDTLSVLFERQGLLREAAQHLDDNGMLFWERNRHAEAVGYFERSLTINERLGNHNGIAGINSNLAFLYADLAEYAKSYEYFEKTLAVRRSEKKRVGVISTLINMSVVLNDLSRFGESVGRLEEALSLAQEMNDEKQMRSVYGMLAETYQKAGDAEKAMYYYNFYRTFNDYVTNETVRRAKSEVAQHRLEEENLRLQNRNNELELQKQRWELGQQASNIAELSDEKRQLLDSLGASELINRLLSAENDRERMRVEALEQSRRRISMALGLVALGIVIVALALSFVLVVLRNRNRYARVLERKNDKIAEQAAAMSQVNAQLVEVNAELAERNELILSGIRASRTVQDAVFSYSTPLSGFFSDSFHISRARDIVSGDFHYARRMEDGTRIVVVGDCTGHGVPAAFLTILAIATLNHAIFDKHIESPDEVLMTLNKIFSGLNEDPVLTMHSMDVAIICIPPSGEYIDFAGARNGVLLVTSSGMQYHSGSRFEIGGHGTRREGSRGVIELKRIELHEATWCYMYSDGAVDQLNGQQQKFSTSQLHAMLEAQYKSSGAQQREAIEQQLLAWQQDEPQTDDMLLVGVRIEQVHVG